MNYSIRIKRSAARELARIATPDRQRIVAAIDLLAENPYAGESLKGQLQGLRRIRIGTFRVLYEIQKSVLVVLVVRVGHRRSAYRGKRK